MRRTVSLCFFAVAALLEPAGSSSAAVTCFVETVHTVETEKIVSEVLAREYPSVPEAVFQSQVLNHVYGEVLVGAIQ